MKKSEFLSKYNYIDYYTKPKGLWFFTINEIEEKLEFDINFYKKKLKNKNIDLEDDYYDEIEDNNDLEIDSYEYYKQFKEDNPSNNEQQKKNIYMVQGNVIDQESKKYICDKFKHIKNHVDIEKILQFKKNAEQAKKTQELLESHESIILFQPVFIYKNLITKSDAVIKENGKLTIIETKGTTVSKFVHYLDLYFQMNVIENQKYLKKQNLIFEYELCLIKYKFLNKHEVSLETTPFINLSKTISIPPKVKENRKTNEIISISNQIKKGVPFDEYSSPLKIKDLMYENYNDIESNIECAKYPITRNKYQKSYEIIKKINTEFDIAMLELQSHKDKLNEKSFPLFEPSKNDKSPIKNCDYFAAEKKLYSLMGYNIFDYSGNVANQSPENLEKAKKKDKIENFLKKPSKNLDFFINLFSTKKIGFINKEVCNNQLNKLHENKVYFDFETISSPIGVIDNSLPFMQIVTQCSIIKSTKKDKMKDLVCNNLIIDPKKIDINWFKKIIDSLYFGSKPIKDGLSIRIESEHDTSYIVYNKSFECSRLKEMAKFINEKEYLFKVEQINNNIYDLADFFILSSNPTKNGYIIFFKELYGFYSIKKVLPLVGKYNEKIYKEIKCLDYNSLEIGNGQVCQEETTKRFLDLVDDNEWKKLETEMKIYCENDVRSMLAIELFIKEILEKYDNVIE